MRIFLFLAFCFPFFSFAQLFNPEVEWFQEEDFFNQDFINNHSIKQFRSSFYTKQDGEFIDITKSFTLAQFKRNGQLSQKISGSEWLQKVDSTFYTYQYDEDGRLLNKGEFLGQLKFQYIHVYNDASELEKLIKMDMAELPYEVVSIKKFKEEQSTEGTTIILSLNDKGKPYMKETSVSEDGKLLSKKLEYLVNSNFQETVFNYLDGKLRTKTITSNMGKNLLEEYNYYYDEKGNWDEIVVMKNGERDRKIAFVYNSESLPTAMVIRYYQEKKVDIYQFTYEFY